MTLQLTKKHSFSTVFDSQKVFRLILEAMSNPTRVVDIKDYADKLYGDYPALLAVAMTLLDNEVNYHVCGSTSLKAEIASLALAKAGNIEVSDFTFVCNTNCIEYAIEKAKYGTLTDPHKSATVIVENNGEPFCRSKFSGPGINGRTECHVTKTVNEAIAIRDAQCYEYPQGIDMLFISSSGELFAIPRLTRMEVQ